MPSSSSCQKVINRWIETEIKLLQYGFAVQFPVLGSHFFLPNPVVFILENNFMPVQGAFTVKSKLRDAGLPSFALSNYQEQANCNLENKAPPSIDCIEECKQLNTVASDDSEL